MVFSEDAYSAAISLHCAMLDLIGDGCTVGGCHTFAFHVPGGYMVGISVECAKRMASALSALKSGGTSADAEANAIYQADMPSIDSVRRILEETEDDEIIVRHHDGREHVHLRPRHPPCTKCGKRCESQKHGLSDAQWQAGSYRRICKACSDAGWSANVVLPVMPVVMRAEAR